MTAKIRFYHDLEDGWYNVKFSNGMTEEYNRYYDAVKYLIENDIDYEWEGDDYYNPEKGKIKDEPWMNANPLSLDEKPGSYKCCAKYPSGLCVRHDPLTYIHTHSKAETAIIKNALNKLSSQEFELLNSKIMEKSGFDLRNLIS